MGQEHGFIAHLMDVYHRGVVECEHCNVLEEALFDFWNVKPGVDPGESKYTNETIAQTTRRQPINVIGCFCLTNFVNENCVYRWEFKCWRSWCDLV